MAGAFGWSDAAKRCSDIVQQAIADRKSGYWVAIRLSDGGSDGTYYATRYEAVYYQLHETLCMYVKVPMDLLTPAGAERLLAINRQLYAAGLRLTDPEAADRAPILPDRIRGPYVQYE